MSGVETIAATANVIEHRNFFIDISVKSVILFFRSHIRIDSEKLIINDVDAKLCSLNTVGL